MDQEERRGADPERQAGEDAQARPEAETARDPAAVAGADAAAAADPAADAATAAAAAAVRDADPAAAAAAAAADFEDGAQRDGFEVLAEEFTERLRRGEGPTVEEYAARRPELAGRIRDLFPAILTMERSKMREAAAGGERISLGASRPDRLGDFRIVREIGRGGMGIVYEAVQESLGRRVAVKVLPRTSLLDATHLRRFQREARTAAHLHHTNIVAIFGVGHHEGFHYYVMQYIDGVGLDQVLAELRRSDAADPSAAAASLAGGERGAAPADSRLVRATTRRIREDRLGLDRPASGRIETEPADEAAGEAVEVDGVHASDHGAGSRLPSDAADAESGDGTKAARSPSEGPPGAESRSDGSPPSSPSAEPEAPSSSPRSSTGGKLGRRYWQAVARIGRQVAAALEHAHAQGILHRDVKPGNLLLDEAGVVWVTDFGLAKAMEQDGVSQTGDIVGTLGYMAPEQLSGRTDARSDIYSLGLTLYELLTLRPAYADTSRSRMVHDILHVEPPAPRKIRPEIPADLETIVVKSIAREPGHRYQSAGELADDLGRFLDGLPILARRSSSILRLWRWARRNRAVASLSGLALLLLVLVAVVASVGYFQTRRARDQESEQRQRAEAATAVAQEAFDEIFDRFAPSRIHAAVQWTIEDAEGEEIPVRVQPVLSKEAALLLEQTLRFYQQLAQQEGSDARLRRKIAEASRRVGDIHQRLGDVDAARQAYERALDLYAKLEGEESGAAEISVEIARIHNELGNLSWAEEEPGFPSHLQALSILRSAGADLARSAEHRYELARTYYFLARSPVPAGFDAGPLFLEGQRPGPDGRGGKRGPGGPPRGEDRGGDRAGDRPSGPEGGPWGEPPFDRPGDGGTDRLGGDGGVDRPGGAEPPGGEPAGGRRETPRDGVFPAGGPPPEWRHRGPRSRGERPEGMPRWRPQEQLEEAIAILGELAAEFPSQPEYRRLLALCHRERSRAPLPFDARRRAEDMERSLEILRSLVEEHPDVAEYRHDLAETCALTQIPTIFFRPWGQPALSEEERLEIYRGAKAQLEEAVAIAEALVTDHPNVPDYANSLVRFRRDLAETLLGLGDVEAARREIESARSRQELLVKRFPEVVSYRLWRAMLEESRARVLELSGDPDGALAALAASAADLKRLLEENPGLKQAGGVLFATMRTTAAVLKRQGREEEARELFRGGGPPRPPGEGPPERSGPTQQP